MAELIRWIHKFRWTSRLVGGYGFLLFAAFVFHVVDRLQTGDYLSSVFLLVLSLPWLTPLAHLVSTGVDSMMWHSPLATKAAVWATGIILNTIILGFIGYLLDRRRINSAKLL